MLLLKASVLATQQRKPDLQLEGTISGTEASQVASAPGASGVSRITVDFSHTGKEEQTMLDLGIDDPRDFALERREQIALHDFGD